MRRFTLEICGVECWSREKVVKNLMFLRPKFGRGVPRHFWGTSVNRHHIRPTGHVWLRSHGWSLSMLTKWTFQRKNIMALPSAAIIKRWLIQRIYVERTRSKPEYFYSDLCVRTTVNRSWDEYYDFELGYWDQGRDFWSVTRNHKQDSFETKTLVLVISRLLRKALTPSLLHRSL